MKPKNDKFEIVREMSVLGCLVHHGYEYALRLYPEYKELVDSSQGITYGLIVVTG
jgi:hypothetical protein